MNQPLFDYVVGIGGIGKGILFELEGNHTMGRNESRQASLTDYHDYCKIHIILHYVATFLGSTLPIYAIGRVGADEQGRMLRSEMEEVGIDTSCVLEDINSPTMYAVCYQYPNGENCNVFTCNSACQSVGKNDVDYFFKMVAPQGRGLVLAVPEVPIETRLYLLERGRKMNCYNVAAVLSGEVERFVELGGIEKIDLLAINDDEAQAFAHLYKGKDRGEIDVSECCIRYLQRINPDICLIITQGSNGAIARYREHTYWSSAIHVPVVNTAGAGDCFIGTVIAAMIKGISLFPTDKKSGILSSALDLGNVAAEKKIGCKDTIDFSMNNESLERFAREYEIAFSEEIYKFLSKNDG